MRERLERDAATQSACHADWRLRVSAAPKGHYVVGLATAGDLQTRGAANAQEAEVVASLLLRVAVDRVGPAMSPAAAHEAPAEPAPAPPAAEPAKEAHRVSLWAGLGGGLAWSERAGVGPFGRIELLYKTPYFAFGIAPDVARLVRAGRARTDVDLPMVAFVHGDARRGVALGAFVELGAAIERASPSADGSVQGGSVVAPLIGAGPAAEWQLPGGPCVRLALAARYVAIGADGGVAPTAASDGGPNGVGVGKGLAAQKSAQQHPATASPDGFGGLGLLVLASIGLPLLRHRSREAKRRPRRTCCRRVATPLRAFGYAP